MTFRVHHNGLSYFLISYKPLVIKSTSAGQETHHMDKLMLCNRYTSKVLEEISFTDLFT